MEDNNVKGAEPNSFRRVNGAHIDTAEWATPDEGALSGERQALYFARKQAVLMFLNGATNNAIKEKTNFGLKQVYRLIRERCLEPHADGQPYGWRGLTPYQRTTPYRRNKKVLIDTSGSGAAGAMQAMLNAHPELRREFDARILALTSNKKLVEVKRSKTRHHAWFTDQLRTLGYETRQEWPFNSDSCGYYSVSRYIDQLLATHPKAQADKSGGPDLVKKLKTGDGTNRPPLKFMQRVEMDAHKLDGRFCVSIPLLDGGTQEKIIHRLQVVVILEVVSRVIIGYHLSLRREISKEDVLRAIKRGLSPWHPRPISFCDTAYLPGAGLLCVLGDDFARLCWDETSVDGALAETCVTVRDALRDVVGSTMLDPNTAFSKRRSKDDRPFIEAYFRNLAGNGFQRMSNTTGAKPQDRKGKAPEAVALASRFQYEYAEELLDVFIANYNATPHHGISNRTPLAYARFLFDRTNDPMRRADLVLMEALLSIRKRCVVRGGARTGRAPFVEFRYARYSNETLNNRHDLVGKEIWLVCHKEDDCRIARASTLDGVSLGILRAAPPWHISPHSLAVRSAICQAGSRDKFSIPTGSDPVEVFMSFVESQAHSKLPVHPAYLEARRILVAATEQAVGTSMLQSAKARAAADTQLQNKETKTTLATAHSAGDDAQKPLANQPGLPPRRMTAVK